MARRKISLLERNEQPMNWWRAILAGAFGATFMGLFVDIFAAVGATPFSLFVYLGSLVKGTPYGTHSWTAGFLSNFFVGGTFGIFYAYCFEFVFRRSSVRLGILLGFAHTVLAAVAIFPFFQVIHEQMQIDTYRGFGFFGSGMGADTVVVLLVGHLLYGAAMGAFYGPVRSGRVRMRLSEPGDSGTAGDPDVITAVDDPEDAIAV